MAASRFLSINGKWYGFDGNGAMVDDDKSITVDKSGEVKIV